MFSVALCREVVELAGAYASDERLPAGVIGGDRGGAVVVVEAHGIVVTDGDVDTGEAGRLVGLRLEGEEEAAEGRSIDGEYGPAGVRGLRYVDCSGARGPGPAAR